MSFDPGSYRDRVVVTDGDFRAELLLRGWPASDMLERANLLRPEVVRDVAEAFLDAGAKVLVTNTAGANTAALTEHDATAEATWDDVLAMNRQGAAIYRTAVSEHPAADVLVFGAMGPTPQILMLDEIEDTVLQQAYGAQAKALAAGGVDAILCRAFTEIRALSVAVRAAAAATDLPIAGTMIFDSGPEQDQTALGVTVPQASAELSEAGAAIVGCVCGVSPDTTEAVVSLMRQSSQMPIWVKVNAGEPELDEGRVVYPEAPAEFAGRLERLARAGANFVGGCCGASAEHIAAFAAAREPRRPKR